MKRYLLTILLSITLSTSIYAQKEYKEMFETAQELYDRELYVACESMLDRLMMEIPDQSTLFYSDVMATKVMCAIKLRRVDAESLVLSYERNYPTSPSLAMIKYSLASVKFDKREFIEAMEIIDSIKEKHLYKSVIIEYNFKKGYSQFRVGRYEESLSSLQKVIDAPLSQYTYPAYYYSAYVNYLLKNFNKAYEQFVASYVDKRFLNDAEYYALECKFMMDDYDYVIAHSDSVYEKATKNLHSSISRMVSESYFAKGDNAKAKEYLNKFVTSGKKLSRKDTYFSGVISYSLGGYRDALRDFESVMSTEDTLGQSAYYYAANSYLKLHNKVAARDAFKFASECAFDKAIQEDAFFNYAKLSFDVNKDISQFEKYSEMYPSNDKAKEINTYMSIAYLTNKDYASAIDIMHKVENPTDDVLDNLQKANMLRAVQLMNNGGYRSAMAYLNEAINIGGNKAITNLCNYYLAECYYRNNQFERAIEIQNSLATSSQFKRTAEYEFLFYNLGYSYFKQNDFQSATRMFDNYISTLPSKGSIDKDARLRLADSYFMIGDYERASREYLEADARYSEDGDIYAAYQAAMAKGLSGDLTAKSEILRRSTDMHPSALLYSQSLFELGRTYVVNGDSKRATLCFNKLLNIEDSTYYDRSLLELAQISSNNRDYKQAISYYEKVIDHSPQTSEAQDALNGMESIYQMQNNPTKFIAYLDKMGLSNIKSEDEKEMMVFNAAEQIFLSGKGSQAISALNNYLNTYPQGVKRGYAQYYIGKALKELGRNELAMEAYSAAIEDGDMGYMQDATADYADILYLLARYNEAVEAYDKLIYVSTSDDIRNKGMLGKIKSYFGSRQYYKAVKEASKMEEIININPEAIREANFYAAKSYMVLGERDVAKRMLVELAKNPSDAIGAESAFLMIQDYYDIGDFVNVENNVYSFSEKSADNMYWLAKSFIVLGDSFADRDEWEQAKATYMSIKDSYTPQGTSDDVLEQVEMRLNKIEKMDLTQMSVSNENKE